MPQPLPVHVALYSEIIDDLNALDDVTPNSFAHSKKLKDIEIKAIELKRHDIARGFAAFGAIAAAKGDTKKMHDCYKNAMQYDSHIIIKTNYAVSMNKCGLDAQAFAFAESLYDSNKGDIPLLHILAGTAFALGNEEKYLFYSKQYKRFAKRDHESWAAYLEEMREIKKLSDMCLAATLRSCAEAGA